MRSFVGVFIAVFIAFVSFVRLFDSLSRVRLGHPLSLSQRCLRVRLWLHLWPLGSPTLSHCRYSLTYVRLGSAYVCSFVRLPSPAACCPLPAACVSALFGVFHQHISCLSLSDENYVDDVGAALPLLTLTLSRFVCLPVSLCALCTSPPQQSRCQPPLLMSTSATTSESCAKLEHQHFVCALLLFIFMFVLRPLPIPLHPTPFFAHANS